MWRIILLNLIFHFTVGQDQNFVWNLIWNLNSERFQERQSQLLGRVETNLIRKLLQDFRSDSLMAFLQENLADFTDSAEIKVSTKSSKVQYITMLDCTFLFRNYKTNSIEK